jgi:DNA modification methylase
VATAALKPGAAFYVAHPAGALHRTFTEAVYEAGWLLRQNLVWDKGSMILGHSDYHYRHEPVMYGYTAGEGRRGRGGAGWYGDNSQTSVFEIPKPSRSEDHPTMKPVALVTAMLANSCPRKGLVYEPFGGSGTTLIAAHHLGMRAAVVELDARYADVILRRAQGFCGITPERVRPDGTTEPVSFT